MSDQNSSLSFTQEVMHAKALRQNRDMSDTQIAQLYPPFSTPTAKEIASKREGETHNRLTHTQRALVSAVEEACWRANEQSNFTDLDNTTITLTISDLRVSVEMTQNSEPTQ